jgi:hypothetical protein
VRRPYLWLLFSSNLRGRLVGAEEELLLCLIRALDVELSQNSGFVERCESQLCLPRGEAALALKDDSALPR